MKVVGSASLVAIAVNIGGVVNVTTLPYIEIVQDGNKK